MSTSISYRSLRLDHIANRRFLRKGRTMKKMTTGWVVLIMTALLAIPLQTAWSFTVIDQQTRKHSMPSSAM